MMGFAPESQRKTAATPFASSARTVETRFEAALWKTMQFPELSIAGLTEPPLASPPLLGKDTLVTAPPLKRKMSETPFVSVVTRFVARLWKATIELPAARLMTAFWELPLPANVGPAVARLTSVNASVFLFQRKMLVIPTV